MVRRLSGCSALVLLDCRATSGLSNLIFILDEAFAIGGCLVREAVRIRLVRLGDAVLGFRSQLDLRFTAAGW